MAEKIEPAPSQTAIVGRCATCRFGQPIDGTRLDTAGVFYEDDERSKLSARYPLFCVRAEMDHGLPEDRQTLAFTMDGSSYRASLLVAPEFGCVMYEAKP